MQIKEIKNKSEWEEFIKHNSPQSFFQSWNWGEVVNIANDEKVIFLGRFGIYDVNDKLLSIFQVNKISARRGIFLQVRHGPILSKISSPLLKFLKDYLISLAKKENSSFIRISPLVSHDPANIKLFRKLGFINSPIHRMDGEYCWVLDLNKSDEELLGNMRKTTRYLIRSAIKNNVEIKTSTNPKDINDFLKLYTLTSKRHHFIKHQGIKEEFEILEKDNQVLLFKGYHNKKLLSAAIIIFYQDQAIYHHSASIEQKIPVNYLLQWQVILEAKKRLLKVYNFWGIAPPVDKRHPWRNLTLFKMGFGGRVLEYLHSQDLAVEKISYLITYLIEYFRKIRKGY